MTNCHRLKLPAADGKSYLTDLASLETLLRLIQSVPSPKAEPIKLWLAKVGYERMQELADPALSLERARELWQQHGRSAKWIQQRMMGQEYAILTNLIHQEWAEVSIKAHKDMKGLKTQNLRDHMSEAELIFTALAELSNREIAEQAEARGMQQNEVAATRRPLAMPSWGILLDGSAIPTSTWGPMASSPRQPRRPRIGSRPPWPEPSPSPASKFPARRNPGKLPPSGSVRPFGFQLLDTPPRMIPSGIPSPPIAFTRMDEIHE